jgi:protein CpxP
MNKIATTLIISSLALGGFTVANADDDRYERRGYPGKYCDKDGKGFGSRIERMTERLNLSDEQRKQVRAISDNYRPKMRSIADERRKNRQQLREVMLADTVNQGKVKKLAQKAGDLKTDKIILRGKMHAEVNKVLTKEQREEMKEWKGRRGYGRGYKSDD